MMSARCNCSERRRGATAVLVVVSMPVIMGMAALTIDVGVMYNTRADLQNSADAAALAAIDVLAHGTDYVDPIAAATETAVDLVQRNTVMGHMVTIDPATDLIFGRAVYDDFANTYSFTPGDLPTNAIRVSVRHTMGSPNGPAQLYFAGIFGKTVTDISAQAGTMFSYNRYDERDCGYVPAAGEVVLCAPVGTCGEDSDDSGIGGDSVDSDDSAVDYTDCFDSDSGSGPGGLDPLHTIVVDVNAVPGFLANGAALGPCACVPGTPDDPTAVQICHASATNPANSFVLTVAPAKLNAHLAHGDTMGNCPGLGTLRILLFE